MDVSSGIPLLVGEHGDGQLLDRMTLAAAGKGTFDEAFLQRLIHENPACLPISKIEPGLGPFHAICREMPTPHGYIDNLLISPLGDIAIVETKLFRNPEARRKVLAQVLDYAVAIFGMTYDNFEKAALSGTFGPNGKPSSLYEALPAPDKLPQAQFVDRIVRNLRRGSALLLIVGDGIRSETESLLGGLNSYTRFHFTLALVELAVFRMPGSSALLIRPSTLAKTESVTRYVIETLPAAQGTKITTPTDIPPEQKETLSSEAFWDTLEEKAPGLRQPLEALISQCDPLGVYPEFHTSLILKWQRPGGNKPVNLGYITPNGALWTDFVSNHVPHDLARRYVEELATAFDCDVHPSGHAWTPFRHDHPLRINDVRDRLLAWPPIMERFIAAIKHHDEAAG